MLWVDQKTEAGEVLGGGKTLLGERQLQCLKPFVTQAFDLCALGREIVGLPFLLAPLIQVMHLFDGGVEGQFRVGNVVQDYREDESQQHHDQGQHTE